MTSHDESDEPGRDEREGANATRVDADESPLSGDDPRPVQHSWPDLDCFGCGPANPDGIHLESVLQEDGSLVAVVDPEPRFQSGFSGAAYGGYVASLIDCNSIWAAMTAASLREGWDGTGRPPVPHVTGSLSVDYHAPTPTDRRLRVRSWVDSVDGRASTVRSELGPVDAEEPTATGEVVAVRVER